MYKMKIFLIKKYEQIINFYIKKRIFSIVRDEDFKPVCNEKPKNKKKILFVIPGMRPYSGGHTSILRLAFHLHKLGHEIAYVSVENQSVADMEKAAKINLEHYAGAFYGIDRLESASADIVVATSWETVFFAKKIKGYKMYFVQDYEPYFYGYNELFLLAKKSYEMGFHMVSLGQWNKWKIEKECKKGKIDVVDFPYENKEYHFKNRNFASYQKKKKIILAVYIKQEGKRLPNLIQLMLVGLKKEFNALGKELEVRFFGLNKADKVLLGTNLGKLRHKELERLYHKADFGMVASMSNISLVPYEMLATGLPLIEFKNGTFEHFFGEDAAILTDFSYEELFDKMQEAIREPWRLEEMQKRAGRILCGLSWEKTGEQFNQIIEEI